LPEEVMSVREVAEFLGLTESTIYKKVRRGELPVARIGRSLRFPKDAIRKWLAENTLAKPAVSHVLPDTRHFTVTTGGRLIGSLRREELYRGE